MIQLRAATRTPCEIGTCRMRLTRRWLSPPAADWRAALLRRTNQETSPMAPTGTLWEGTYGCTRHQRRSTVGIRPPKGVAQGGHREHDRHDDRVVRLPAVQHRHSPRVRQIVFPAFVAADRRARSLCGVFRWLCRTTHRRIHLWPLRRPHRPQGGADRDALDYRPVDLCGRLRPRLRLGRRLGRGDPDRHPDDPGHRGRR